MRLPNKITVIFNLFWKEEILIRAGSPGGSQIAQVCGLTLDDGCRPGTQDAQKTPAD